MKKIFLYVLCVQLFAVISCNDNTKSTEAVTDSTKTTATPAINLDEMKAYLGAPVPGFDPQATIQNLSKYPDLYSKTQTVKFNYNNFSLFIDSMDRNSSASATNIYLFYGALTPGAVNWYLKNHTSLSPGDSTVILNRPCLVIGYKNPSTGMFYYATDIGTICPPPNSCESFASYPFGVNTSGVPGFSPGATIDNYDIQYQDGKNPIHPLTARIKFDIAAFRYLVDSLGRNGVTTSDIYFVMGAYTSADAQRYVTTHPANPPITPGEIQDRTCLLLAFKKSGPKNVSQFNYYDLGTICPPPNSCETAFQYKR